MLRRGGWVNQGLVLACPTIKNLGKFHDGRNCLDGSFHLSVLELTTTTKHKMRSNVRLVAEK